MDTLKTLMGIKDAKSNNGIFARGKANYGVSGSPNPMGNNQAGAAKLLLERRKKNGINFKS